MDKKDEVLLAENEAKEKISVVLQEKDDLLRQAKDKAKKDLTTHDDELRMKTQEKITALLMDTSKAEEVDEQTKKDLVRIEESFKRNKESVSQFLFTSTIKVDINIPEVVIGNFEERMK